MPGSVIALPEAYAEGNKVFLDSVALWASVNSYNNGRTYGGARVLGWFTRAPRAVAYYVRVP